METKISKQEFLTIKAVLERMGIGELLDADGILDGIGARTFDKFFSQLPTAVLQLSKQPELEPFIKSLDDVSSVLNHLSNSGLELMDLGYFLKEISNESINYIKDNCGQ